jgi:hypothetical protein
MRWSAAPAGSLFTKFEFRIAERILQTRHLDGLSGFCRMSLVKP